MRDSPPTQTSDTGLAPGERPTLKTIARLSGLAVATVSRALNDAPDIGAKTKARVRDIADQVGYRPNRAGVRLRTGKTNVISLVMSTDHDMMNHTARLISSIAAAMRHTTYHMIMTPYFKDEDPMDPVRYIVETGSADGIILNQTTPRDPRVAYLMKRNFPFTTHGRTDWASDHPYCDFDNDAFAALAMGELARRGRRNVKLVLPPLAQNYAMILHDASMRTAADYGIKASLLDEVTSDEPGRAIEDAMRIAAQQDASIDGVICASTASCLSVTTALESVGRVLGRDVDVAGKEAIPFLKQFRPAILTVFEDVAEAGEFCAQATMARIADPKAAPMQRLQRPEKIE